MKKIALVLSLVLFLSIAILPVRADELDDVNNELSKLQKDLNASLNATKPLESDLNRIRTQLTALKNRLTFVEKDISQKELQITKAEKVLVKQKEIIDTRINAHYRNIKKTEASMLDLIVADNLSTSLQNFFYQKKAADNDKQSILRTVLYIKNIDDIKEKLTVEKSRLSETKSEVDKQSAFLSDEVGKAKKYQSELSGKIASLTSKQQSLIGQKLASLGIPRSAGSSGGGRCSSDLTNGKSPGFSPAVGFFTYGAPHRNGLNQYGAYARAKAGQSEDQILAEYYPSLALKKDYDQNAQVNVDGHGTFTIEDYVKRIWEVPNSWGDDGGMAALKAQAVAARTYALNSMNRNGHICTTEACQVFRPEPKGGNWDAAVEATKGWVLMDGGNAGFTQYASTHGGYILNIGKFDGAGGNPSSFAELNERAYDKASPWFYCNWGSRSQYGGTAWLKPEEVTDIANVILLARYSDVDKEHLYQPDKSNPAGKETWDANKVITELRARGGSPVGDGTNASVSVDFGSGKTSSISIGGTSFSGSEFKDWFNLRAPANIQIVGPLFNVERK